MTRLTSVIAATVIALLLSFSAYAATPDSGVARGLDVATGRARAVPGTVGGQGGPGALPNTSTSVDLGIFFGAGLLAAAGAFVAIQRRRSP